MVNQLRALGVRIAIDDFGTGYSSLEYLLVYRVSRIKIAQQFVDGLPGDPGSERRSAWRVNSASKLSPKASRPPLNWNFSLAPDAAISKAFTTAAQCQPTRPPGCCAKVCSSRQPRAKRRRDLQTALNQKEQEHEPMARPRELVCRLCALHLVRGKSMAAVAPERYREKGFEGVTLFGSASSHHKQATTDKIVSAGLTPHPIFRVLDVKKCTVTTIRVLSRFP
jgi:hypothetical protein